MPEGSAPPRVGRPAPAEEGADGIYESSAFRDLDIGAVMRAGHPDVAEGDARIVEVVARFAREQGRSLRILDVGSGSGELTLALARQLPDCTVIANEVAANPAGQAEVKLGPLPNAVVSRVPFEAWDDPVDVVVSWGSHHHLAHDYLARVQALLPADGLLIVGDEFCPEYLSPEDRERLSGAPFLEVLGGYLFDDPADAAAFRCDGVVCARSRRWEQDRRKALWRWYKFVGDYAVARDAWDVVLAELVIARDDLITGFAGEHKTSPHLLACELSRAGFTVEERLEIGQRRRELLSFVVFVCRPGPAIGRP
jgi:cyclopropane fatty-acyl-phospholipid synthase-like methyltransferase